MKEILLILLAVVCVAGLSADTQSPADAEAMALIQSAKDKSVLTNVVQQLAVSGEICKVRGHRWDVGVSGIVHAVILPEGYRQRRCAVCDLVQTSTQTDWK